MQHLLTGCSFSRQVWHEVLYWCRSTATIPDQDEEFITWLTSALAATPRSLRRGLASIAILTAWWLWKHRNGCVFNGDHPSVNRAFNDIREEARLWARAGASGLALILPET